MSVSTVLVAGLAVLTACNAAPPPLPTLASVAMEQTSAAQTQAAPPTAFQGTVSFPAIDAHLSDQPAWDATVSVTFDGVYANASANKPLAVSGSIEAQIIHDELLSAQRVLFNAQGAAFGLTQPRQVEAVRLGNDYYLVAQGTCGKVTDTPSRQIADLSAASLLGGVQSAKLTGQQQEFNALPAWEYAFTLDSVSVPLAHPVTGGSVTIAAGSLWIAPSINAVVRFSLTVNVQNVTLLDAAEPVTGQLRETYTLGSTGQTHNISIPYGC